MCNYVPIYFFFVSIFREKIHRKAMDLVIGAYDMLYKAIFDTNNNYTDPNSIIVRTTEQVKTLLS